MKIQLKITLVLLVCCTTLFAQNNLQGIIVDKESKAALPFANILDTRTAHGAACDETGLFELPNVQIGDTLLISYVGYETRTFLIESIDAKIHIELEPLKNVLSEFVVRPDNAFLYELLDRVRKNQITASLDSKTYFLLETNIDDTRVEVLESYYQGSFKDHGIAELELKKGRAGRAFTEDNQTFHSSSTSRVFLKYSLFKNSPLFPVNPLAMRASKMRKFFALKLEDILLHKGHKMYVVSFESKSDDVEAFSGRYWIDTEESRLVKVEQEIQGSKVHPFIPIGDLEILGMDLALVQNFDTWESKEYLQQMDFNYEVTFRGKSQLVEKANTKAFMRAFAPEEYFNLPLFDFGTYLDYRNILVPGYDYGFWSSDRAFSMYSRQEKVEAFLEEQKMEFKDAIFYNEDLNTNPGWFEFPFFAWDSTRIHMKQASDSLIQISKVKYAFEEDRYHFCFKLYADCFPTSGGFSYQLGVVMDPFCSYYYFPVDNWAMAFMNIHFDLLEIVKRELDQALKNKEDLNQQEFERLVGAYQSQYDDWSRTFRKESRNGKDHLQLIRWANIVKEELDVDNIYLFGMDK